MPIRYAQLLVTLLVCVALLAARMSNAHLHLCMDGQEPPASVHYGDEAVVEPHHPEIGVVRHDVDIELGVHFGAKPSKLDLSILALLLPLVFLLLARTLRVFLRRNDVSVPPLSLRHLRPPPCGPPSYSVA